MMRTRVCFACLFLFNLTLFALIYILFTRLDGLMAGIPSPVCERIGNGVCFVEEAETCYSRYLHTLILAGLLHAGRRYLVSTRRVNTRPNRRHLEPN